MAKAKKMTIKDIAELAGVSAMTVSKVANGKSGVAPKTRKKIEKLIQEYDYHPSSVALRLQGRSISKNLCILVSQFTLRETMSMVNFHSEMWRLLVAEGCLKGYRFMLTVDDLLEDKKPEYVKMAEERSLCGFITMDIDRADTRIQRLIDLGIPVVLIGLHSFPSLPFYSVCVDDYQGGYMATEYLIKQGYQNIAFLSFQAYTMRGSIGRLKGFRDAMRAHDLAIDEKLICFTEMVNEEISGYEGMKLLLSQSPNPDAVFCASDLRALGAIRAIQEAGLRVKDDIAVLGYDDFTFYQQGRVSLSTVHQPFDQLAHQTIEIFDQLSQNETIEQKKFLFSPRLVLRDSA